MTELLEEKRLDDVLVAVDPEALIEEARQRQRRRRRAIVLSLSSAIAIAAGVYLAMHAGGGNTGTSRGRRPAVAKTARTLNLRLLGWGTTQPDTLGSGPCPWGRTSVRIMNGIGHQIGEDNECVLLVSKEDVPNYGVRATHAVVIATFTLPSGTIRARETQDFRFAGDQKHSYGRFRGSVLGGSGRYANVIGTLVGGGPGVNDTAHWNLVLDIHRR